MNAVGDDLQQGMQHRPRLALEHCRNELGWGQECTGAMLTTHGSRKTQSPLTLEVAGAQPDEQARVGLQQGCSDGGRVAGRQLAGFSNLYQVMLHLVHQSAQTHTRTVHVHWHHCHSLHKHTHTYSTCALASLSQSAQTHTHVQYMCTGITVTVCTNTHTYSTCALASLSQSAQTHTHVQYMCTGITVTVCTNTHTRTVHVHWHHCHSLHKHTHVQYMCTGITVTVCTNTRTYSTCALALLSQSAWAALCGVPSLTYTYMYLILACIAMVERDGRGKALRSESAAEVGKGGATASKRMFRSFPLTSALLLSAGREGVLWLQQEN